MSGEWMRIVSKLPDVSEAVSQGFRNVQLILRDLAELDDDTFHQFRNTLKDLDVNVAACSSPLPDKVRVTQRGFNTYAWTEFARKGIRRMGELACHTLIWNDGKARLLPWEGDILGAKEQLMQFLSIICDAAAPSGINVLVGPLGPRKANFLNSMSEVQEFMGLIGKDNLSCELRLREMADISFGDSDFSTYASVISHVLLENPVAESGGVCPRPGDGFDYAPFFRALKSIHYAGSIALPEDADAAAREFCEELWATG